MDERNGKELLDNYFVGKSIFTKSDRDLSANQQRMTILEIKVTEIDF